MARGKQGHIACKKSSSKNPQNNCSQPLWAPTRPKVGAGSTYHKKEGATLHPVACKFSWHNYRRPDEQFGVRVGIWNLDSLSGKWGDVCEELIKRMMMCVI